MTSQKRVVVIGGTGFLGFHTIKTFRQHGWQTTAIGLPQKQPADHLPDDVQVHYLDIEGVDDRQIIHLLSDHDALIYAAGLDDRHTPEKPAYPVFRRANVDVPLRVLGLAKEAGIQRAVVFGSYFYHFARRWPELKLSERHPYIRSRTEQGQTLCFLPGLHVNILELPYIFGGMPTPGWKPLWSPLVKYLRMSKTIYYMRGGTACISANTVGQAAYGAITRGEPGVCYPIGQENLSWQEMLSRLAAADGRSITVKTIPDKTLKFGLHLYWLYHTIQGKESGLDPRHFAALQTAETFIDPHAASTALGYELDSLDTAFHETVSAIP